MKSSTHDALLSFLGGASWAFAIVGVWITFKSFIFLGLMTAFMFTFLFLFLALFIIVVLQNLALSRERYDETLKQTALLEEMRNVQKLSQASIVE